MIRNENEQEFVLGNKQLLSAFFVVVMLLGVFFAMGYIVGHNSTAEGTKKTASGESAGNAQSTPAPDPAATVPPPVTPQDSSAVPSAPMPTMASETKPARPEPERSVPVERPFEKPVVEKASKQIDSGPGHTYLQVSAVKRPAADSIVKTLKDKGFPSLLGESSKPELFRVLVGPYADTESLTKAKSDLKAMGFDAVVSK